MARSINDLYNTALYIVRKERGIFLTPNQFSANLDAAQMDAFEEYFKIYGENQEVHDALRVFRTVSAFISAVDGSVSYQTNHMHLLGSPYIIYGSTFYPVRFVNEDEFPFALTSQLRPVSPTYPIAVDNSAGFTIYPNQAFPGSYTYLKRPNTPVLGYIQSGRTITYNGAASTQLQWTEVYWNNILAKSLIYSGVDMNEEMVTKYAMQYNEETKA